MDLHRAEPVSVAKHKKRVVPLRGNPLLLYCTGFNVIIYHVEDNAARVVFINNFSMKGRLKMTNPNVYELELTKDGEVVNVALRLTTAAQITLKKHWQENTIATMMGAVDDPERMVDVLNQALNWPGNANPVKKGDELADIMADNGLLGIVAKQRLMTALCKVSGILSEEEHKKMDDQANKMFAELTGTEDTQQGNA